MTERVLNILRRQGKRIYCLFDGDIINTLSTKQLKILSKQIEEIGSIRKSIAVFDYQLKPEQYELYISNGISPVIVPSDKDVYLALECLDIISGHQVDILSIGVSDESMLPIIMNAREKNEILLIVQNQEIAINYRPYIDYLIALEDIVNTL